MNLDILLPTVLFGLFVVFQVIVLLWLNAQEKHLKALDATVAAIGEHLKAHDASLEALGEHLPPAPRRRYKDHEVGE